MIFSLLAPGKGERLVAAAVGQPLRFAGRFRLLRQNSSIDSEINSLSRQFYRRARHTRFCGGKGNALVAGRCCDGNVDVERLSPSELRIAKVTPNDGWMQQVTAPSGPRVTVKFTHPGASPSVIRFAASMDQAGRVIHIRVQACG